MSNPHLSDELSLLRGVDDEDIRVYRWAVAEGGLVAARAADGLGLPAERVAAAICTLAAVSLIRPAGPESVADQGDRDPPGPAEAGWSAVDPRSLSAELARAEAAGGSRPADRVDLFALRTTVDSLTAIHAAAVRGESRLPLLEIVESFDQVIGMLDRAGADCTQEVLTSKPSGGLPAWQMEQAITRDLAMLDRGIRIRTLYQHAARHHPPTQVYAERLTAAGGHVRTLTELLGRMIVFDRALAFVPHTGPTGGAVVLRDLNTVSFLCDAFDRAWLMAIPYSPTPGDGTVQDGLKLAVLNMLRDGMKDETIARRLGLSVRTTRKHIAEILRMLGAESRFQAGFLAHQTHLLGTVPSLDEPDPAGYRPDAA